MKKVIRPRGRGQMIVRYKAARPMSGEESTFTVDWLAPIRAELPIRIEGLPDLRARWPGFGFRLAWPEDSLGLVLEVTP